MARFYSEDVRDDCLYRCDDWQGNEGNEKWTAYRVTASRGDRARIVPLDPAAEPTEIRVRLVPPDPGRPESAGMKYRSKDGTLYYTPKLAKVLIDWMHQCRRDGAMVEASRELLGARRRFELGDRLNFDEVEPGVFKMRGFEVYAASDDRCYERAEELLTAAVGTEYGRCMVGNLDEAQEWVATDPARVPGLFQFRHPEDEEPTR